MKPTRRLAGLFAPVLFRLVVLTLLVLHVGPRELGAAAIAGVCDKEAAAVLAPPPPDAAVEPRGESTVCIATRALKKEPLGPLYAGTVEAAAAPPRTTLDAAGPIVPRAPPPRQQRTLRPVAHGPPFLV